MLCYLIGTSHAYQLEGQKGGDSAAFAEYLSNFCAKTHIDLIAEELNEEAIAMWHSTGSVARSVASKLCISHRFCDPDREARKRLGVLTEQDIKLKLRLGSAWTHAQVAQVDAEERKTWPAREGFWLETLRQATFVRCAFVLGAKHVETFGDLLGTEGFTVHVAHSNWTPGAIEGGD